MSTIDDDTMREINRELLKSEMTTIFFAAIAERKKAGFSFQALADAMGINKSTVSRWFATPPNWELNTVSDLAHALNLRLEIRAHERDTGAVFEAGPPSVVTPIDVQFDLGRPPARLKSNRDQVASKPYRSAVG